jgi:6-phosphogluconolactonase
VDVRIFETTDELQRSAADLVADYLRRGGTDLALAGGSTPQPVHRRLAGLGLSWSGVTVWLGDERWVPPDHEDANARMARETLVDDAGAAFVAPDTKGSDTGGSDPAIAAAHYEIALRTELPVDDAGRLSPGLVMLGMGADGHTASLFPGTDALERSDRDYVATWVPKLDTWRLTATFPTLWAADRILFLVTGAAKAPIIEAILEGGETYPAGTVAEGAADVTWLLDAAAASGLRSG